MAEQKDSELIIAYFPSADEAQEAGKKLKEWDKEREDIKLGAISILTMDAKGKLKEHSVGVRTGGKGAKWGVIAGAVLGLLTAGTSIFAGAVVGLVVGGLGGSLFHKKIGMSDEDQAKLQKHLEDGGAALAVMMDYEELESTISELTAMNAEVATYNIPQQVLDDIERMAKGDEVIHEIAQKIDAEATAHEDPNATRMEE